MINNNKILTVSYGTFSCTLEGFDDSFGTMKAIAEYFRDLAADDRYFGAEPAQPDAQMLARIAQREISRHVEAREDDGRIVLSAKNTDLAAALVAPDVEEDVASDVADDTDAKQPVNTQDAPVRARAKTATPDTPQPAPSPAPQAETDVIEDEPDIVPSLPDADVEAFFADTTEEAPQTQQAVDSHEEPAQDRARADSIADKLKRIRAVVSQQTDAQAAPDYSEDQHAEAQSSKSGAAAAPEAAQEETAQAQSFEEEDDTDASNDVLADTLRDLEDALDADDEVEAAEVAAPSAAADDTESDDDDITAILNRLEREATPANLPQNAAETDDLDDFEDDDMDDNILAAMDPVNVVEDAEEDNLFDGDDLPDDAFEEEAEEGAQAPAPKVEAPAPAPVAAAPRTRVLKVKRATLEAAIQAGKLEEYDSEEEAEDAPKATASAPLRKAPLAEQSSLSEEAEAELARELAELEADMAAAAREATAPEEHTSEKVMQPQVDEDDSLEEDFAEYDEEEEALDDQDVEEDAPAPRAELQRNADANLSRLMAEASQQMKEPESATRRDAFAHLRAAVAAKKADEAVGGKADEQDTDEAYRNDLASVVRPRRPVNGERGRTERPAEPRPAPLKLVAEQRIDVAEARKVLPVRPRRVATITPPPAREAATTEAASFADFASDMGAVSLPDLLEAAAAYLSFVEGHEQFSRPQLMTKVRQVEKESFTREDSLRSFGKLLREGKIEKLSGGRFQASDQIGFKPDARAAG